MRRLSLLGLLAVACSGTPVIQSVSVLGDTDDEIGPYGVTIIAIGVQSGDTVELRYAPGVAAAFTAVAASADDRHDHFVAFIPGQPLGTPIRYFIDVARDGELLVTDPPENLAGADGGFGYTFHVLARAGGCRADTDCAAGLEVCSSGTCRAYNGTCVVADAGLACPDGYACDLDYAPPRCVVPLRACVDANGCPTVEMCDPERHVCLARPPCAMDSDCATGQSCDALGLCQ